MAKLHLGKETPNNLTEDNFQTIGQKTEGYSGSDLATTVREALMEPLRECQMASHFYPYNDPESGATRWLPVTPTVTLTFAAPLSGAPEIGGHIRQAKATGSGNHEGTIVSYNASSKTMEVVHLSGPLRPNVQLVIDGLHPGTPAAAQSVVNSPPPQGAKKMTLMEVDSNALMAPDVTFMHFMMVVNRGGGATVAPEELTRFEEWTKEFGQEG